MLTGWVIAPKGTTGTLSPQLLRQQPCCSSCLWSEDVERKKKPKNHTRTKVWGEKLALKDFRSRSPHLLCNITSFRSSLTQNTAPICRLWNQRGSTTPEGCTLPVHIEASQRNPDHCRVSRRTTAKGHLENARLAAAPLSHILHRLLAELRPSPGHKRCRVTVRLAEGSAPATYEVIGTLKTTQCRNWSHRNSAFRTCPLSALRRWLRVTGWALTQETHLSRKTPCAWKRSNWTRALLLPG